MKTVPLRYRLPNPPADFVGRQDEVQRVAASLREVHVTVLVGPGGVGKTALALHTLQKRFAKRVPRTLHVSLPGELDGLELSRELLRALAAAEGTDVSWSEVQDHGDALSEALLDLAEAGPYWIFLDDLHHAEAGRADQLLETLSFYARQSRYLVTTRSAPQARLASGRVLPIGGLDSDATLELARRLSQDHSGNELVRAVRASGGSPWLLREALVLPVAEAESAPSSQRALLEGLEDRTRRVAFVLSRIDVAVPASTLSHALGFPEKHWYPELIARGWIQETPAGIRLHDVARQGITGGGEFQPEPEVWLPVARELAKSPLPVLRLDGIRLLVEGGALETAEQALGDGLDQLLGEGYAPKLWKLLARVRSDRLDGVRLRCAAELGSPTVLRQIAQPTGGSPEDRLTWAETLYMRGNLSGALDTLMTLTEASGSSLPEISKFDAALLHARLLIAQDRVEDAHLLLTRLVAPSPSRSVLRDTLLESCAPVDPRHESDRSAALASLQNLEQRALDLRDRQRTLARFYLAIGYLRHNALDAAERVLDSAPTAALTESLALFEARCAAWLRAAIDVARGRLTSAQEKLDELEPFLGSPSLIRAEVKCTRARLWMAQGHFKELLPLLQAARAEAETLGLSATAHRAERLFDRVEEVLLEGEGLQRKKARSELMLEHLETSASELQRSVRRSLASGHLVRAAEDRSELCSALLLLGRTVELNHEATQLGSSARDMGSVRWRHEAELFEMFRGLDWARLEGLAQKQEQSPWAARCARALLSPNLVGLSDPLDQAVVQALSGPTSPDLVVSGPGGDDWQAGWGLDVEHTRVWLPSGKWLDLTRRMLPARLLVVLAERGGSASKQELVEAVWGEPEYHPLRHDTRLQVTVHKLRELLEQDAGAPRLLLTTQMGYCLVGPFRVLKNS